jgi:hypothetical protein
VVAKGLFAGDDLAFIAEYEQGWHIVWRGGAVVNRPGLIGNYLIKGLLNLVGLWVICTAV